MSGDEQAAAKMLEVTREHMKRLQGMDAAEWIKEADAAIIAKVAKLKRLRLRMDGWELERNVQGLVTLLSRCNESVPRRLERAQGIALAMRAGELLVELLSPPTRVLNALEPNERVVSPFDRDKLEDMVSKMCEAFEAACGDESVIPRGPND